MSPVGVDDETSALPAFLLGHIKPKGAIKRTLEIQ